MHAGGELILAANADGGLGHGLREDRRGGSQQDGGESRPSAAAVTNRCEAAGWMQAAEDILAAC
jgi:hypothetical protein